MDTLPDYHSVAPAESPFQYMLDYPKGRLLVTPDSRMNLPSSLEQAAHSGIQLQSFSQAVLCWLNQPNRCMPLRNDFQNLTSTVRMKRIEGKWQHVGYAELLPTLEHAAFAEEIRSGKRTPIVENGNSIIDQLWTAAYNVGRIYEYYDDKFSWRGYDDRILEDNKHALFSRNALGNYLIERLLNTDLPVFLAETKRSILDSLLEPGKTLVDSVSFHASPPVSEATWGGDDATVRWVKEVSFEELQQRGGVSVAIMQDGEGRISVSDGSEGRISRS